MNHARMSVILCVCECVRVRACLLSYCACLRVSLVGAFATTPRDGAWEDPGMENYWDSRLWKIGQLKYGSLWERDTWGG